MPRDLAHQEVPNLGRQQRQLVGVQPAEIVGTTDLAQYRTHTAEPTGSSPSGSSLLGDSERSERGAEPAGITGQAGFSTAMHST